MRKNILILLILVLSIDVGATEISGIKERYIQRILNTVDSEQQLEEKLFQYPKDDIIGDQMIIELMDRYHIEDSVITSLVESLQEDGAWKDIDFSNMKAAGWPPKNHAARILELARAYRNPKHTFYQSKKVADAIHRSLGYWFKANPKASNWWYNEIGIPKVMGAVFILFEEQLSPLEKAEAIKLMDNSKIGMTAQNRVWLAGNVLVKGLLVDDIELVKKARNAINEEIKIAPDKKEGIKVDNSFHQHGAQLQYGNYGAAYLATMSFWAYVLSDSELSIDQDRYSIICNMVNDGFRRVFWKNYLDINCMGRQFYINGQRHKGFSLLFSANALAAADKNCEASYRSFINENLGEDSPGKLGQYHFWRSDMTIQREPQWMFSLKMSSDRVIGTEGGSENVKGYYLADGATYTYVDGKEYENIFPCWDWRKIPGVTCFQSENKLHVLTWLEKQNKGSFVGNVNDGHMGITSMHLTRDGLNAKKTWIITPDYVLCLGADISSDSSYLVTTSIEQALLKDDLLFLDKGKWNSVSDKKTFSDKNPLRFIHDKIGYIVMDGSVQANLEQRTASWNEIMKLYPTSMTETKSVFSIFLDHGMQPKGGSYQYVILPATDKKKVKAFNLSAFRVISNTSKIQAVQTDKNTYMVAMFEKGSLEISKKIHFESDKAGLFILKMNGNNWEVIASDPNHKEQEMEIVLNAVKKKIHLPQGEYAGTSVSITNK